MWPREPGKSLLGQTLEPQEGRLTSSPAGIQPSVASFSVQPGAARAPSLCSFFFLIQVWALDH